MNAANVFALEGIEEKAEILIQEFKGTTNGQKTVGIGEDEAEIGDGCLVILFVIILFFHLHLSCRSFDAKISLGLCLQPFGIK